MSDKEFLSGRPGELAPSDTPAPRRRVARPTPGALAFSALGGMVVWSVLWSDPSAANLIVGAALGVVVALVGWGPSGDVGVRPLVLARLAVVVMVDLVKSTVQVAQQVLTGSDGSDGCVVVVEPEHLLSPAQYALVATSITLTPGAAVIETDPTRRAIAIHVLDSANSGEVERGAYRLAALAAHALPDRSAIGSSLSPGSDGGAGSGGFE